ncbi:hypothetical protein JMJ58_18030 [Haloterrigena salifodinae]|uniref:Uncharacterized protein n=1 Tax=Haloterrigena salifodinae TaxID=2675099 RepID=A0A8T8E024_9EURY|nr:hypothetical protein [Haloterrigena salifodinae]QRV14796.1 hypothetical protein JMJ58_18030 [Haloterrigena salifodinae]
MNQRTAIALTIGLAAAAVVAAGATVIAAPGDPVSDSTENTSENMTETEFSWGTVIHETDAETGDTNVEVIVDADDDVSISTITAPNATDMHDEEATADGAAVESFPWGAVIHATDSDTGATDIEVIVDADNDVSVSVTSVSENGAQTSTSSVTSTSETSESGTSVSQSTVSSTTVSSSSVTSSSTDVTQSSNWTDDESIEIDIDTETEDD